MHPIPLLTYPHSCTAHKNIHTYHLGDQCLSAILEQFQSISQHVHENLSRKSVLTGTQFLNHIRKRIALVLVGFLFEPFSVRLGKIS